MLPYHTLTGCVYQAAPPAACQLEFYPAQRAGAHGAFCRLITQIQQHFHAQGQLAMLCVPHGTRIRGDLAWSRLRSQAPAQQDKYCGVHCLTQLWQWECQQLPCIFSLQLSPARQQGQHREQPGIWRHRAAKNAKPRLALLFPTSVTKSMAELKHRRGCDLWL